MQNGAITGENRSRRPVFITRFGLSDRTAVGVQTKQILENFPAHTHLYWNESVFDSRVSRSHRIESFFFSHVAALKRNKQISRLLTNFDVSWWKYDKPAKHVVWFLESLREETSSVYLAPLDASDARRMKEIVAVLQSPFVLHLWDFLDNASDETTRWLIENASRVFCLNGAILKDVISVRDEASILTFRRSPAKTVSKRPDGREISVAISGDIGSYLDGVKCLAAAIQRLRKFGQDYKVVYVGTSQKMLRRHGITTRESITATGFIPSADQRDLVLSRCTIGFMPGPLASPESDPRSKYSIPSRILDFMAIGLPIVGTVHPESATYSFCRDFGLDEWLLASDPDQVAHALKKLADPREWERSSQKSLAAFSRLMDTYDIAELRSTLI